MSALQILKASLSVSLVHFEAAAADIVSRVLVTPFFAGTSDKGSEIQPTDAAAPNDGSGTMVGSGAKSVRLIVGLGNYSMSPSMRHNVGFQVLDHLALRHRAHWSTNRKLKSMVAEVGGAQSGGDFAEMIANSNDASKPRVVLMKPKLFMNESGDAVARAIKQYSASVTDVLIVHDDLERVLGKISFKECGSAGGHNGVRSVISSTRSQAFPRVRVGIGRPGKATVKNFVLQDFDRDEALALHQGSGEGAQSALDSACDMIDKWIDGDLPTSKNKSGNKQWKNKLAPVAAKDALYNGN